MTDQEKIAFKTRLKKYALDLIGQRIATAKAAMEQAQEAANNEEKSSAGDKYETGRAMGHLQKDMHARQLTESMKELATLHAVPAVTLCNVGRAGAFLQANGIAFFISAGLGKQIIEGQTIVFLSPLAPLANLLQDKKTGDQITFNKEIVTLRDVF